MRPSELMLHDLVEYDGKYLRVVEISEDTATLHGDDGYWAVAPHRLINPIPLTASHFEANEWEKDIVSDDLTTYTSPNGRVSAQDHCANSRKWYIHIDNERFESIGGFECDYVNELQHILRLGGLDEMANGFKIKEAQR